MDPCTRSCKIVLRCRLTLRISSSVSFISSQASMYWLKISLSTGITSSRIQPRTRPAPVPYPALISPLAITPVTPVVYVALSHNTVSLPLRRPAQLRNRAQAGIHVRRRRPDAHLDCQIELRLFALLGIYAAGLAALLTSFQSASISSNFLYQ